MCCGMCGIRLVVWTEAAIKKAAPHSGPPNKKENLMKWKFSVEASSATRRRTQERCWG